MSERPHVCKSRPSTRENLREDMAIISRTAKSMEYAIDGVADKFRFGRKIPDADLLTKAYAFLDDIPDYKAAFISYGMPATFDAELQEAAEAFELSMSTADGAVAEHIAGTANVGAKVRQGMTIIRVLDGIAKNVYNANPIVLETYR